MVQKEEIRVIRALRQPLRLPRMLPEKVHQEGKQGILVCCQGLSLVDGVARHAELSKHLWPQLW